VYGGLIIFTAQFQGMEIYTVLLLAIGLSFDSFAVSVSSGVLLPKITFIKATRFAFILALFQAIMPVIGWFAGSGIRSVAIDYDHWIAFVLLSVLGVKMIYESQKEDKTAETINPLDLKVNISLAIATSIDAFVIGISMAFMLPGQKMVSMIIIIGAVTFIVSMLGMLFGKKVGSRLGKKMEVIGGLILICLGVKILFEHLYGISILY
jgi:manganese efflux pump family protein